jgi:hypothetical protein
MATTCQCRKKTAALCKLLAEFERVMPVIRSQTPQVVLMHLPNTECPDVGMVADVV